MPSIEMTNAALLETPLNPMKSSYKTPYDFETLLLKSLKSEKFRFSFETLLPAKRGYPR